MQYDSRIVDQVRMANDIVDVVSQYVQLKRAGKNFKGLSPFKEEKTPSFMVSPQKQVFYCFSSGIGGDVFSFLMRLENLTFPEALRMLAEKAHIPLPEPSRASAETRTAAETLYAAHKDAAQYYRSLYLHPEAGKRAREYFTKRSFSAETSETFGIGWAPEQWQGLYEFLKGKGYQDAILFKSGLVHQSPQGRPYDVFRGRLLFPIHNLQGKVMGFGGRLITKAEGPKYLNSPETLIFQKGRELFGLFFARRFISKDRPRLILVEGYMDFLRLFHAGFKNTVATLGTALSNDHVRLMKRFAEEAVVIYDGDSAGISASLRGLEVFLAEGMNVKLVRVPDGLDPDDFIVQRGAEAFQSLLDQARDFFDYKMEILREIHDPKDPLGIMRITSDFLETLANIQNPILLDHYLKRLASGLEVHEDTLRAELSKFKDKTRPAVRPGAANTGNSRPVSAQKGVSFPEEEILLITLLLGDETLFSRALTDIKPDDFSSPEIRKFYFELLARDIQSTGPADPYGALSAWEDDALKQKIMEKTFIEWDEESKPKAYQDCLRKVRERRIQERLRDLRLEISQAEKKGDLARVEAGMKEYQTLLKAHGG
ncbi:MAG: DNA primase [Candidatus Omnitrophota bacterium]